LKNFDTFLAIWNILLTCGICYVHLVPTFCVHCVGTFFPVLVSCTKQNPATLTTDFLAQDFAVFLIN
jgi:hypothetical protein